MSASLLSSSLCVARAHFSEVPQFVAADLKRQR